MALACTCCVFSLLLWSFLSIIRVSCSCMSIWLSKTLGNFELLERKWPLWVTHSSESFRFNIPDIMCCPTRPFYAVDFNGQRQLSLSEYLRPSSLSCTAGFCSNHSGTTKIGISLKRLTEYTSNIHWRLQRCRETCFSRGEIYCPQFQHFHLVRTARSILQYQPAIANPTCFCSSHKNTRSRQPCHPNIHLCEGLPVPQPYVISDLVICQQEVCPWNSDISKCPFSAVVVILIPCS